MAGRIGRACAALVAVTVVLGTSVVGARPAEAAPLPLPQVPVLIGNPTPGTDLFASTIAVGTGGTQRRCATSALGIPVTCVEGVLIQPAGTPTAIGTTYGHWVFCRFACTPSLLVHELVHVHQFEQHGDVFGPMYLLEAAQHGTGCENVWERPAYQAEDRCP